MMELGAEDCFKVRDRADTPAAKEGVSEHDANNIANTIVKYEDSSTTVHGVSVIPSERGDNDRPSRTPVYARYMQGLPKAQQDTLDVCVFKVL